MCLQLHVSVDSGGPWAPLNDAPPRPEVLKATPSETPREDIGAPMLMPGMPRFSVCKQDSPARVSSCMTELNTEWRACKSHLLNNKLHDTYIFTLIKIDFWNATKQNATCKTYNSSSYLHFTALQQFYLTLGIYIYIGDKVLCSIFIVRGYIFLFLCMFFFIAQSCSNPNWCSSEFLRMYGEFNKWPKQ